MWASYPTGGNAGQKNFKNFSISPLNGRPTRSTPRPVLHRTRNALYPKPGSAAMALDLPWVDFLPTPCEAPGAVPEEALAAKWKGLFFDYSSRSSLKPSNSTPRPKPGPRNSTYGPTSFHLDRLSQSVQARGSP